uniref:SFRICE_030856 n=1 Tax=Spodoptera frugiperda TaxID=7108 RepID=A0A2H1VLR4_SPOFR
MDTHFSTKYYKTTKYYETLRWAYDKCYEKATIEVSTDGKQLQPLLDTRNTRGVTSALQAFGEILAVLWSGKMANEQTYYDKLSAPHIPATPEESKMRCRKKNRVSLHRPLLDIDLFPGDFQSLQQIVGNFPEPKISSNLPIFIDINLLNV